MAKKSKCASSELLGISIGRTYSEKEVRKSYCNTTKNLDEKDFQDMILLNSDKILMINTPFEKYITFTDVISAKGIVAENAKHFGRSPKTAHSPVRSAHSPKQSLMDKYKIRKK